MMQRLRGKFVTLSLLALFLLYVGYRIYENFGPQDNALIYGFQLNLFLAPTSPLVFGGAVTALFGYTLRFANTMIPQFRFLAQAGAFVAGPMGSTFIIGPVFEMRTRIGIGITAGVQYFAPGEGLQATLDGAGVNVGLNYALE